MTGRQLDMLQDFLPPPEDRPYARLDDLAPAKGSRARDWQERALVALRERLDAQGHVTADDVAEWVERTGDAPYHPNHMGSLMSLAKREIPLVNTGRYVVSRQKSRKGARIAVFTRPPGPVHVAEIEVGIPEVDRVRQESQERRVARGGEA